MPFRSIVQATGTSGTATISKPTGTVDGDFVGIVIGVAAATTLTPPAGLTSRRRTVSTGVGALEFFTHIASGDTSYSFTLSASGTWLIEAFCYTSVDNAAPYDTSSGASNTSGTALTATTITPANNNAQLIYVGIGFVPGTTYSALSGTMVARETAGFEIGDETFVTAGATGSRTCTASGSGPWAAMLIALKPAPPATLLLIPNPLDGLGGFMRGLT